MLPLELLVSAVALLILCPVLILFAEVLIALISQEDEPESIGERPRVAVLMPAHNEASGIRDTLSALLPQLRNGDRLLVIADNCTDDTATIAASMGAEVVVRHDSVCRGKGYALDFGVHHLRRDPPGVVLILDADCRIEASSVDRLAYLCSLTSRPVQALNLIHTPPEAGPMVRIAEFASALKNRVRPLALRRLGLPCHLTGTGMAFPWMCISKAALATGHIVEDLKLGLELAGAGMPPLFCPQALVTSYFPASNEGFKSQRTRWEHGYLSVLAKDAPAVLLKALSTRNGLLLALGIDLCVPPIALLTLLIAAVWIASVLAFALSHVVFPFLIASATAVLLAASVLIAWSRFGRGILSFRALMLAVGYALWKVPLYGRFIAARQLEWVRAKRDEP